MRDGPPPGAVQRSTGLCPWEVGRQKGTVTAFTRKKPIGCRLVPGTRQVDINRPVAARRPGSLEESLRAVSQRVLAGYLPTTAPLHTLHLRFCKCPGESSVYQLIPQAAQP